MDKTYFLAHTIPAYISWTLASSAGSLLDIKMLPYLFFRDPACWLVAAKLLENSGAQSASTPAAGERCVHDPGVQELLLAATLLDVPQGHLESTNNDQGSQDTYLLREEDMRHPLQAFSHSTILTPESLDTHYTTARVLLHSPLTYAPPQTGREIVPMAVKPFLRAGDKSLRNPVHFS
jgi:hypothetical protein